MASYTHYPPSKYISSVINTVCPYKIRRSC
jgi:hypothetical protein